MRFADTLRVNELPHTSSFRDTLLSLTDDTGISYNEQYFHVRSDDSSKAGYFNFKLETTGACQVFVDYFKISDQYAEELFAHEWDSDIIDSTGNRAAFKDNIIAWFLKDTEGFANYMPFGYIKSLMDSVYSGWKIYSENASASMPGIVWELKSNDSRKVSSGVFFIELKAAQFKSVRKIAVLR